MNKIKVTDIRRWPQDPPDYYFEIKYVGESFTFIRYVNGTESMHSNRSINDETVPYNKSNSEEKESRELLLSIVRQDHNRGYPTGKEWNHIVQEIKRFLLKYPKS